MLLAGCTFWWARSVWMTNRLRSGEGPLGWIEKWCTDHPMQSFMERKSEAKVPVENTQARSGSVLR
jgi:hypothetical protein